MSQNLPNASIPEKLPPFVFAQWRGEPRSLNAAPGRPSVGTPIRGDPEGLHRPELIGKWAETSTTEGAELLNGRALEALRLTTAKVEVVSEGWTSEHYQTGTRVEPRSLDLRVSPSLTRPPITFRPTLR
jgi:hypothetical protein